jgi:HlyD family secretion protein
MDIARPSNVRQKRIRQAITVTVGLLIVAAVTVGLSRLQPAAPTVEAATLWPDTVKRGPMVRQVRGLGTLVPEDIRWIPATTQGRVEKILLRPGTAVTPDSVILELSNDQLETDVQDAQLKLQSAEASLANLRVQMQNDLLRSAPPPPASKPSSKAKMQAEMNEALAKKQLVSELMLRQSKLDAEMLATRLDIAREQPRRAPKPAARKSPCRNRAWIRRAPSCS